MTAGTGGLYLIDSSVWIPTLRRAPARTPLQQRVDDLLAANAVATTGMIRLELLRGARDEQQFHHLRSMLNGLHQLATDEGIWEDAARLGLELRLKGIVLQSTDLLIAAVALHAGAIVLHRDSDFDLVAKHTPLLVEGHL